MTAVDPHAETANDLTVRSPADGRAVAEVPNLGPAEVVALTDALRGDQAGWEQSGFAERARWAGRFRDWLLDHEDELAGVLREETGKPWPEARLEVLIAISVLNYYCDRGAGFLRAQRPRAHNLLTVTKRLDVAYRPYPLVGVIAPWNFPLTLALGDAFPALLAGAAVIVKPSELTPLAARRAIAGWAEIGAPPVFACATGDGMTGAAVVQHVDFVQFTGSTRTGRRVAEEAGARLIPCSLELGGNDAAIVLADADLSHTARGIAYGGLTNAGQMCTSVERVYVQRPVYDEFVELLVDQVRSLRLDRGDGGESEIGPLASAAQLAVVRRHVEDAVAKGARVLTGGAPTGDGLLFEPTVLVDVDHTMEIMREETFGPVLPVMRVADADEAIQLANDSDYGLSASIWTRDTARGRRIAGHLHVGAVDINDASGHLACFPAPQAGWNGSGLGARFGAADGIRKFCRPQSVVSPRIDLPILAALAWYPYSATKTMLVDRAFRLVEARDLRRRLFG